VLTDTWKPRKRKSFWIHERGKLRHIESPDVRDRQVEKVITQDILLKGYKKYLLYNNGASLKGKGLHFTFRQVKTNIQKFQRKYNDEGSVILLDLKQFFPTAPHSLLYNQHRYVFQNDRIRHLVDLIVQSTSSECGMPIGVEPSQAEMVAAPSKLDHYIACQLHLAGCGHYMDDYIVFVPPHRDVKQMLERIIKKAAELGFTINSSKCIIQSIVRPIRFCKATFIATKSSYVVSHGNRDSVRRFRRRILIYVQKWSDDSQQKYIRDSIQSSFAYYNNYDDHHKWLKLHRFGHNVFHKTFVKG